MHLLGVCPLPATATSVRFFFVCGVAFAVRPQAVEEESDSDSDDISSVSSVSDSSDDEVTGYSIHSFCGEGSGKGCF